MKIQKGFYRTQSGGIAEVIGKSVSKKMLHPWVGVYDSEEFTSWDEGGVAYIGNTIAWWRNLTEFLGTDWREDWEKKDADTKSL